MIVKIILRVIAGLVFIFSGTVKGIDPMGSAFKFHDYFQALGLEFLSPLALPLAIALCLAEFITGFAVVTGIRYREGITGMFLLIVFFTPLTFILAVLNPVSDCGCFGDAIHLTNWETFGKNVILFIIIYILFRERKKFTAKLNPPAGWSVTAITAFLFVLFSLYNLRYLPVIDFLPYKTGNNIPELMKIPEGAITDKYESTFIYEKDGITKEFTLNDYPANDTSWKFVDQKTVLVKKGYEPPVHGFSIVTMDGTDLTQNILSNQGLTMLMVSRKLGEAAPDRIAEGIEFSKKLGTSGIDFYLLTSSATDEISTFSPSAKICQSDETALKTMIRTNPGYILLRNGTVMGKWSWANMPDIETIVKFKE
jgi:hypothetical protein